MPPPPAPRRLRACQMTLQWLRQRSGWPTGGWGWLETVVNPMHAREGVHHLAPCTTQSTCTVCETMHAALPVCRYWAAAEQLGARDAAATASDGLQALRAAYVSIVEMMPQARATVQGLVASVVVAKGVGTSLNYAPLSHSLFDTNALPPRSLSAADLHGNQRGQCPAALHRTAALCGSSASKNIPCSYGRGLLCRSCCADCGTARPAWGLLDRQPSAGLPPSCTQASLQAAVAAGLDAGGDEHRWEGPGAAEALAAAAVHDPATRMFWFNVRARVSCAAWQFGCQRACRRLLDRTLTFSLCPRSCRHPAGRCTEPGIRGSHHAALCAA